MAVEWTTEQQQVIDLRDRNILVSAAAGSGKTAVLVERILKMITTGDNPLDVDKLLVVTFTRAAAAEMKERLLKALEARLFDEPENEHLQRQTVLIHNAQINTIHGFCGHVIKNYFHLIDLDPGYRIADDGELKLLKIEVAQEVIEAAYEVGEDEFLEFVEWHATGKTDDSLEGLIMSLYEFAMSHPWPKKWLQECKEAYSGDPQGEMWFKKMWEDIDFRLDEALDLTNQSIEIAQTPDGPHVYEEMLMDDKELIMSLIGEKDYNIFSEKLRRHVWEKLAKGKGKEESKDKRQEAKEFRDKAKDVINALATLYFYNEAEAIWADIKACEKVVGVLVDLTIEFEKRFTAKKRKKNILDYPDMEHLALNILVDNKDGNVASSAAACELSEGIAEILIDEYQDSNGVQEMILASVSKQMKKENNIFMVGDVKQSIYRFRLARPELFMDKYHNYTTEESECQKIDLHKNFRSRSEVLDAVNYLFYRIMHESLGGVTYDEAAALYTGAIFPKSKDGDMNKAEILLIESDSILLAKEKGVGARELEARVLANRIEEIVGNQKVFDKDLGDYRLATYRDCVILLRTIAGWGDTFARTLNNRGIPAYVTSRTGYFSAIEVVTVLNYLHICDNPQQEIPFVAILRSPIVGCSDMELATLKNTYRKDKIYDGAFKYCEEHDDELGQKLTRFYKTFDELRSKVSYTPIHELIRDILSATNYERLVSAMPAGEQRSANIKMLVEKAIDFERTSYRGLFNFIRYIEQLRKYSVDYGEVNLSGEQADTVRIMSIHQSKGLEFPIVFAAGMGKDFNLMDSNGSVVLHPDYGIGTERVQPQMRLKSPTLLKKVIGEQIKAETLGEEMRVLYVALTRAKEKLIITGTIKKSFQKLLSASQKIRPGAKRLSYVDRIKAKGYWDWILPVAVGEESPIDIHVAKTEDLIEKEIAHQVKSEMAKKSLDDFVKTMPLDDKVQTKISERFSYIYPYESQVTVPIKVTVSELKANLQKAQEEEGTTYQRDIVPLVPNFIEVKEEEATGAIRGTAYHRVMECLDFTKMSNKEEIVEQLQILRDSEKIDEATADVVDIDDVWQFAESQLGKRMRVAAQNNLLYKEQPFVMSVSAAEKSDIFSDEDTILVQGIIDVFFYEGENIVVADYKTDKVSKGNETTLVDKYSKQLDYYAKAIERVTSKKVTEKVIYSFTLASEIKC